MNPRIRTDIIDVYVVRPTADGHELLQLRRCTPPLEGTWQPVLGHLHEAETAEAGARRELLEETGLSEATQPGATFTPLPGVYPYFLAMRNEMVLSARFLAIAPEHWTPTLDREHDDSRWVPLEDAEHQCHWPDQASSVREIRSILRARRP